MDKSYFEKKSFQAKLENLHEILLWIRERISKFFSQRDLDKVELASEEVIVNIINHAYAKKSGKIAVQVTVNENIEISFMDSGPKFNPISKRRKKIDSLVLSKRKVGGLGIYIIFNCIDDVEYLRKDKLNIFTLIKKRSLDY